MVASRCKQKNETSFLGICDRLVGGVAWRQKACGVYRSTDSTNRLNARCAI